MPITEFKGQYRWLSNFWPAPIAFEGAEYPTVEHAYQAAKTLNPSLRERIRMMSTPGDAKRAARFLPLRSGWDYVKLNVMHDLVRQKFQHPDLRAKLIATGEEEIIEGNTWGDTFWGVCKGRGRNRLGEILMDVRAEVRKEPTHA